MKFRVWNGLQMVYDVTVGKYGVFYVNPEKGDGLNPSDTASLTPNTTKYPDDIPLMVDTEEKDINGNPIYEGDIVSMNFMDRPDDPHLYKITRRGIYIYPELIEKAEPNKRYCGVSLISTSKIVGNIYENANLITNK